MQGRGGAAASKGTRFRATSLAHKGAMIHMKSALVMQTDFGVDNLSVATMRGVAMIVDPELRVFDATHAINQFDVLAASDALIYTIPFWPEGTVFVSVVDPGVGTARKSCVAKLSNGSYIVTPDNGTLTYVKERIGIVAVREIDESVNRYPTTRNIHIFHGRDVYAYCGARLAAGVIDFEGVGPEYSVDDIVMAPYVHPEKQENAVYGMIIEATEHFGLGPPKVRHKTFRGHFTFRTPSFIETVSRLLVYLWGFLS